MAWPTQTVRFEAGANGHSPSCTPCAQPGMAPAHAAAAGCAAAAHGREASSTPSAHHWTSGSAATSATGMTLAPSRRLIAEPMRIPRSIDR
jgi:hypothetical protein